MFILLAADTHRPKLAVGGGSPHILRCEKAVRASDPVTRAATEEEIFETFLIDKAPQPKRSSPKYRHRSNACVVQVFCSTKDVGLFIALRFTFSRSSCLGGGGELLKHGATEAVGATVGATVGASVGATVGATVDATVPRS